MPEVCTSGAWKPNAGAEDAFVEAWAEFAGWASGPTELEVVAAFGHGTTAG
jgi:hypothetical protein